MLGQGIWDMMAQQVKAVLRPEWVTIIHRSTPRASPTSYPNVEALAQEMKESPLAAMVLVPTDRVTVVRGDQEISIATADVSWTPTRYDEILRADGSTWRVQAWRDGPGYPWYLFHVRRNPQT